MPRKRERVNADLGIDKKAKRTSSLIFFQMILVISSPSNSTIGFLTTILLSADELVEAST
jgi:hypothetical protein